MQSKLKIKKVTSLDIGELKSKIDEENEIKHRMSELKKYLNYIDKTNWLFQNDTVDFTTHIPYFLSSII